MYTSFANAHYIQNCATSELVELAFDAQRHLTEMVNDNGVHDYTEADYAAAKAYKATIKAEIVARVGTGFKL